MSAFSNDPTPELAATELLPIVYDELLALARSRMAGEPPGHTLQATALVHEAWLRLEGPGGSAPRWSNRAHYFAAAARAMRRILVERARARGGPRRGGDRRRVELRESALLCDEGTGPDYLALDEALERLEALDPRKARVVLLRHFAGLSIEHTAETLGVSPATVKTDWAFARAWLHREIAGSAP